MEALVRTRICACRIGKACIGPPKKARMEVYVRRPRSIEYGSPHWETTTKVIREH